MATHEQPGTDAKGSRRVDLPSLEQYVYQLIKDDILLGVLRPGASLVEARLAEEFGVSKTPVREALIRLRRDGLVNIERFRGARVAEPSVEDVREISVLRRWIEGGIAQELARSHDDTVVEDLRKNLEASREALAQGDETRYLKEIREFDHMLARATGNAWVTRIVSDLYNIFSLIGAATLAIPQRRERSIDEHMEICKAIERGDEQGAVEAAIFHIGSIEEDYLRSLVAHQEQEA